MTIQLTEPDEFEGGGLQIEDPGGDGEWIRYTTYKIEEI